MDEKPNYYAIIPADVRYDEKLKLGEKMMYGEITALSKKNGICYASNNYFAKLYNVSPQAISKWIKNLEKNNYVSISYERDGKAIIKRNISMVSTQVDRVSTEVEGGINSGLEGYQQEIKENNTSNNNTSINNIKENVKRKYYDNKDLNNIFIEYLDMRKKMKAINSDRAINTLINKLSAYDDDIKFRMIEQSIVNSWKSIYENKLTKEEIKKQREKEIEEWLKEENNE